MAAAADSKSAAGNCVRVRVPPPAPSGKTIITHRHSKAVVERLLSRVDAWETAFSCQRGHGTACVTKKFCEGGEFCLAYPIAGGGFLHLPQPKVHQAARDSQVSCDIVRPYAGRCVFVDEGESPLNKLGGRRRRVCGCPLDNGLDRGKGDARLRIFAPCHEIVKQSCSFKSGAFGVGRDAGKGRGRVFADDLVVVDAEHDGLPGNPDVGSSTGFKHLDGPSVPSGEKSGRLGKFADPLRKNGEILFWVG